MAFGKLQELLPSRPLVYKGQNFINLMLLAVAIGVGVWITIDPTKQILFPIFVVMSLLFECVLLIIPIGGRGYAHCYLAA